ncbi:MAG: PAS domain S-box protein [Actinomycetota bacterium]|nr:PAS domain S-box protein [Actinomycetota bacterium]
MKDEDRLLSELHELRRRCRELEEKRSESLKTQEELKRRLGYYSTILDNTNDVITLMDAQGKMLYTTPSSQRYSGYSQEELQGLSPFQFIHPDDLQEVLEKFAKMLEKPGEVTQVEYRIKHKEDCWVCAEAVARNLLHDPLVRAVVVNARDATKRRRVQEALQESEKKYRELASSLPQVVFETEASGRITYINEVAYSMFKYSEDEVARGINALDVIDPSDHERITRAITKMMDGRSTGAIREYLARRKDSTVFPCMVYSTLISDAEGNPIGIRGILADITEQKHIEEALRENEARARALLEATMESSMLIDLEGKIIDCNEIAASRLGFCREELIGEDIFARLPLRVADDRRRRFEEAIAGREPLRFEDRRQGMFFDNTIHPILGTSGEVAELAVYARDITEYRRAEKELLEHRVHLEELVEERTLEIMQVNERLQGEVVERLKAEEELRGMAAILEATSDFVGMADMEGRIMYMNRAARHYLGVGYDEDASGLFNYQFFAENHVDRIYEGVRAAMREGIWEGEMVFRSRNGEEIPFWVVGLVHSNPEGDVTHTSLIARDLRERKAMEEELRNRNVELDAFARTVSHDLRGSLSIVEGFATTAIREREDGNLEEERECLERIVGAASRMDGFIKSLLAYSMAGNPEGEAMRVEPSEMLQEVLLELTEVVESSRAEVEIQRDLPEVMVDPLRLGQVFLNLVGNALRYLGGNPHPRVRIGANRAGDTVTFYVEDNGIGIPREYYSDIFKPFRRIRTKDPRGLGIGLATVERAVRGWGGEVRVNSKPGEGSTFFFTAPAAGE